MTDQELRDIVATLALDTQAFKSQLISYQEQANTYAIEAAARSAEADRRIAETDKQLRELGKQIGGIHAKFGKFAEGMALNAMMRIVEKHFGIDKTRFEYNVEVKQGGKVCEFDALAISNGTRNIALVLEVKSTLNDAELAKMRQKMKDFRTIYHEHAQKRLYGIVIALHVPKGMAKKVYDAGFYLARMGAKSFSLDIPEGFVGKEF
jgi:hypothetical protein